MIALCTRVGPLNRQAIGVSFLFSDFLENPRYQDEATFLDHFVAASTDRYGTKRPFCIYFILTNEGGGRPDEEALEIVADVTDAEPAFGRGHAYFPSAYPFAGLVRTEESTVCLYCMTCIVNCRMQSRTTALVFGTLRYARGQERNLFGERPASEG